MNEPTPSDLEYYGNDPEGPASLEEHGSVEVSDIVSPLDEDEFAEFAQFVPNQKAMALTYLSGPLKL